jgi:ankyrin repeat protein
MPYLIFPLPFVYLFLAAVTHFASISGSTPLHMSARWGHADICRLLLTAGADVDLKDSR